MSEQTGEIFGICYPSDHLTVPCRDFAEALDALSEAQQMVARGDEAYAEAYLVYRPGWEKLTARDVEQLAAKHGVADWVAAR